VVHASREPPEPRGGLRLRRNRQPHLSVGCRSSALPRAFVVSSEVVIDQLFPLAPPARARDAAPAVHVDQPHDPEPTQFRGVVLVSHASPYHRSPAVSDRRIRRQIRVERQPGARTCPSRMCSDADQEHRLQPRLDAVVPSQCRRGVGRAAVQRAAQLAVVHAPEPVHCPCNGVLVGRAVTGPRHAAQRLVDVL
jgi:hypothetical protein